MKDLEYFLSTLDFNASTSIVVGLSGGPDSMALVNIINKFNPNIRIICAHVHHNLRKESDEEKIFVENYCKDNSYIFEYLKIENYKNNKFSEEEARIIRYDFFESVVRKYKAKYLFTAHHGDDLIETILMRLTRGSTLKGYSGIATITNKIDYKIVRPLLFLTKNDILSYINKNNIPYVTDLSNTNIKYTRNRYRKNILPILKSENDNVHQKFYKFSNMLIEYDEFITKYVDKIYNNIIINNEINILKFLQEEKLIQKNILMRYLDTNYLDDIVLISDIHIKEIIDILINEKPNLTVSMPLKKTFIKTYSKAYLTNMLPNFDNYKIEIKDAVIINGRTIEMVTESNLTDNFVIYLNSKDIKLPLYVKNYEKDDKMIIKNMTNSKKIKDIFINEKVPLFERKKYPIVVDSNNVIVWLPGLKKSNLDSQKSGKYDIILRYY